jgi:ectoine hydroxylase-related dioxygenase (phytanoyl-CoA dioxygenase family)
MMSMMLALDAATPENGCLQVLQGSHRLGRIEHGVVAGQVGADQNYVEEALTRFDLVQCAMAPGDALFFHSNLLHASGANTSEHSRNAMLCCYNRQDNAAFALNPTNHNVPIEKLDDIGFATYLARPVAATRVFMTEETVGAG